MRDFGHSLLGTTCPDALLYCVGYNAVFGNKLCINMEEGCFTDDSLLLWIYFHWFFHIGNSLANL